MALRGSITEINIYSSYNPQTVVGRYQNYFYTPFYDPSADQTYLYKAFTRSDIVSDVASTNSELRLEFFATTENITLVEDSINNDYVYRVWSNTWDATQGIENPTSITFTGSFVGVAVKADITHTTVSLTLGSREDTQNGDFPSKKISYAILGPLNLGQ